MPATLASTSTRAPGSVFAQPGCSARQQIPRGARSTARPFTTALSPARRMRPANPGIAEENVERLAIELPRERLDRRVIRHVKPEDLDHAPDCPRLGGAVGIETGRQHAKSVLGVLTRELDAEAGVATGDQNGGHGLRDVQT